MLAEMDLILTPAQVDDICERKGKGKGLAHGGTRPALSRLPPSKDTWP